MILQYHIIIWDIAQYYAISHNIMRYRVIKFRLPCFSTSIIVLYRTIMCHLSTFYINDCAISHNNVWIRIMTFKTTPMFASVIVVYDTIMWKKVQNNFLFLNKNIQLNLRTPKFIKKNKEIFQWIWELQNL